MLKQILGSEAALDSVENVNHTPAGWAYVVSGEADGATWNDLYLSRSGDEKPQLVGALKHSDLANYATVDHVHGEVDQMRDLLSGALTGAVEDISESIVAVAANINDDIANLPHRLKVEIAKTLIVGNACDPIALSTKQDLADIRYFEANVTLNSATASNGISLPHITNSLGYAVRSETWVSMKIADELLAEDNYEAWIYNLFVEAPDVVKTSLKFGNNLDRYMNDGLVFMDINHQHDFSVTVTGNNTGSHDHLYGSGSRTQPSTVTVTASGTDTTGIQKRVSGNEAFGYPRLKFSSNGDPSTSWMTWILDTLTLSSSKTIYTLKDVYFGEKLLQ